MSRSSLNSVSYTNSSSSSYFNTRPLNSILNYNKIVSNSNNRNRLRFVIYKDRHKYYFNINREIVNDSVKPFNNRPS